MSKAQIAQMVREYLAEGLSAGAMQTPVGTVRLQLEYQKRANCARLSVRLGKIALWADDIAYLDTATLTARLAQASAACTPANPALA